MAHEKYTIVDIARITGVSPMTVSRAINRPELVSDKTRDEILRVVRQKGFVLNNAARMLVSDRSRVVAVIIPRINNPANADVFQGLSDGLEEHGLSLLLGMDKAQPDIEEKLIMDVLGWRPAAIVLTGLDHSETARMALRNANCPIVELADIDGEAIDISIGLSHRTASHALTRELLDKGYRKTAYLYFDAPQNRRITERLGGYRDALKEAGIKRETIISVSDLSVSAARAGARQIMALKSRPRLVFCSNDLLAISASQEFKRAGLRVPEDIAVAGFEDIELASAVHPALTTVRTNLYGSGMFAADAIVKRLDGRRARRRIDMGYEIVWREST
jgi:LacI family gluconate utilization system Gnt-I transcriptional repressor